jgi:hypothetical protein
VEIGIFEVRWGKFWVRFGSATVHRFKELFWEGKCVSGLRFYIHSRCTMVNFPALFKPCICLKRIRVPCSNSANGI